MSSGTFSILQTIVPNVTNNSIKLTFHMNCLFIECGHDMENIIFHEKIVNELKLIGYNDVEIINADATRLAGSAMNSGSDNTETITEQDYTFIGVSAGLLAIMVIYGCYRVKRSKNKSLKDEVVEVNKFVNSHPVALADATRTHSANSISTVWTNIMSENENGHVEGFEENVGTFYNDNDVLTP